MKTRDGFNNTLGGSGENEGPLAKETTLRKQMSSEIKQPYTDNPNYTPNMNKPKSKLINSKPNYKEDSPEEEYTD